MLARVCRGWLAMLCWASSAGLLSGGPMATDSPEDVPAAVPSETRSPSCESPCTRDVLGTPAVAVEGNGVSVRVARGELFSSTNATDWTKRTVPTVSRLRSVAFGNGVFVAVGDEGALVTSGDGRTWKLRKSTTDERLRAVVHGAGRFVAVGYRGTILTSKDGRHWQRGESGVVERLQNVAYGNGIFIAAGWNGCVLKSLDGQTWQRSSALDGRLERLQFLAGSFATSNDRGTTWRSGDGTGWKLADER